MFCAKRAFETGNCSHLRACIGLSKFFDKSKVVKTYGGDNSTAYNAVTKLDFSLPPNDLDSLVYLSTRGVIIDRIIDI